MRPPWEFNCGSANAARFNMESQTGEWRTIRHDAIARVMTEFVVEAGFRTKWQPGLMASRDAPRAQGRHLGVRLPKRRTHTGRC